MTLFAIGELSELRGKGMNECLLYYVTKEELLVPTLNISCTKHCYSSTFNAFCAKRRTSSGESGVTPGTSSVA